MKIFLRAQILMGIFLICCPFNGLYANPFAVDQIVVPTKIQVEKAVTEVREVASESIAAIDDSIASATLWKDLHKLYGKVFECRMGAKGWW